MYCFCPPTWRQWRHMKMLYTWLRNRLRNWSKRRHKFEMQVAMDIVLGNTRFLVSFLYTTRQLHQSSLAFVLGLGLLSNHCIKSLFREIKYFLWSTEGQTWKDNNFNNKLYAEPQHSGNFQKFSMKKKKNICQCVERRVPQLKSRPISSYHLAGIVF